MPTVASFEPVWVSSRQHLAEYERIRKSTPWYAFISSKRTVPCSFPQTEIGVQRLPLVLFSSGMLTLAHDHATFRARQSAEGSFAPPHLNLDNALSFTVERAEQPVISRHRETAGWLTYFHINWVEIALATHTQSILVCVGATTMGRVRRQTDALAAALSTWATAGPDTA